MERFGKSITILLAAYEGSRYAGAQIDSILAQSSKDWFLVVSDDGERTAAVLDDYAAKYPEKILHYRAGRRFGSAQKHFMHLISQFQDASPYLMCCDQDDIWHPEKVEKTLALMKKTEGEVGKDKPILIHTDLRVVNDDLSPLSDSFMRYSQLDGGRLAFHELMVQNVVTGCTMMLNRPLARLAAESADEEAMLMHDWWLALLASAFGRAAFLPEATMDYRQHGDNTVGAKDAGSAAYLKSRLGGGYIRSMRDQTIAQAEAFFTAYGERLSFEQRRTCEAFIALKDEGKLRRIRTLGKYHLWKNTLPRRIGQLLGW